MNIKRKIIKIFEAHDLFDQQGSINVDHGEQKNINPMNSMYHSYPSVDYAMMEEGVKNRIYVDMDNVIVDFRLAFKEKVGEWPEPWETKNGKDAFWDLIESWGSDFWVTLPWMPDGKELWNYISKYDPIILTAAMATYQRVGKASWLAKEVGYTDKPITSPVGWTGQSKVIMHKEKHKFILEPGDILIDDTQKKIGPWNENGGHGILHTSAKNTIDELKQLKL